MGAWDYRPFENDSALDWLGIVETDAANRIEWQLKAVKVPNKRHSLYFEAIAAAALLAECTTRQARINLAYDADKRKLFDLAIGVVHEIAQDASWIAEWDDPKSAAAALASLERTLKAHKAAQARHATRMLARIVKRSRKRKAA